MLTAEPRPVEEIVSLGIRARPDLVGKTLDEIKRGLGIPILARPAADVIERALAVVPEQNLYEMLRLESLGSIDAAKLRRDSARDSARMWADDAEQWSAAKLQLEAAIGAIRKLSESKLADKLRDSGGPDPEAVIAAVEVYARNARRLEYLMRGLHGADAGAGARSPKFWKEIVRERTKVLADRLGKAGWSRGEIADLILAAPSAWDPPPLILSAELREPKRGEATDAHRTRLIERLRDLVDRRSNRRR